MSAVLLLAVLSSTPSATGLALDWKAPEGCPTQESVEALVARLYPRPQPLTARVVVSEVQGRFRLQLETPAGERVLEGAQCEEVTSAAALVLALLLEETPRARPTRPLEPPTPAPPVEAEGLHGSVRLTAVADVGTLALPMPGLRVTGSLGRDWWVLELGGSTFLPQTVTLGGARARLSLDVEGFARGCAVFRGAVQPRLCVGGVVGSLRGQGLDLPDVRSGSSVLAAGLVGVGVAIPVGRVRFLLHGELGVPVTRSEFAFEGQPTVFTTPAVFMRGEAGAEVRFP